MAFAGGERRGTEATELEPLRVPPAASGTVRHAGASIQEQARGEQAPGFVRLSLGAAGSSVRAVRPGQERYSTLSDAAPGSCQHDGGGGCANGRPRPVHALGRNDGYGERLLHHPRRTSGYAAPLPSVHPDGLTTCGVRVLTVFPPPPLRRDQRKRESEGNSVRTPAPLRACMRRSTGGGRSPWADRRKRAGRSETCVVAETLCVGLSPSERRWS